VSDFDDRIIAITEAIDHVEAGVNMLRCATHGLVGAGLDGAKDVAARGLYELHRVHDILSAQKLDLLMAERALGQSLPGSDHLRELPEIPNPPQAAVTSEGSVRGRRRGLDVVPGRVRLARMEAGLSQGQVGDGKVSRAAICQIEQGKTRPRLRTLELIASRTNRTVEWFLGASS